MSEHEDAGADLGGMRYSITMLHRAMPFGADAIKGPVAAVAANSAGKKGGQIFVGMYRMAFNVVRHQRIALAH